MKRWRRIALIATIALLVVVLGVIGGLIWLQSSGRLTRYAQDLVQAYSDQNTSLSFESVAFASWNRVTITNVRLQQTLPGWHLDVTCPRLETRYTLRGLRRKQISAVHLVQPVVHLQTSETPVASGDSSNAIALPIKRIEIQDAVLRVEHGGASYTLKQIEIALRQITTQRVGLDAKAKFDDDTARIHIQGEMSLDLTQPTGTFDVRLDEVDLPRLTQNPALKMPDGWTVTQGMLSAESQVELRGQTVQGTLHMKLQQGHGDVAAVAVRDVVLTTDWTLQADIADRTFTLEGPVHLQAAQVRQASSGFKGTQLNAQAPVKLTYTPERWHVHTDLSLKGEHVQIQMADDSEVQLRQLDYTASVDVQPTEQGWSLKGDLTLAAPTASIAAMRLAKLRAETPVTLVYTPKQWRGNLNLALQSQSLSAKDTFQLQKLSGRLPLEIASTTRQWRMQGTAAIKARSLRVGVAGLSFENVQSRVPIRLTPTALQARDARLQAAAARWQSDPETPITAPLDVRTTVDLNLPRQQLQVKHLDLHLQDLGRATGHATWQWTSGSIQNIRLSLVPTSLDALWPHIAAQLPAPYPAWLVGGQTQIDLSALRLTWRNGAPTQPLSIDWQLREVSFSSPEGDYAGESINGQVEANISLTSDWRPAAVRASLTLEPFALLVGSFFPELQQNGVTSVVTLNSSRDPQTGRFDLDLNSQFGPLGRIDIKGVLDPTQTPMRVDVACSLRQIDAARVWQTFMPETIRQTAAPPTIKGRLKAHLQLRGTLPEALRIQGDLNLSAFHLQAGALNVQNLSLQLPVDIRYPLPQRLPDLAALPASTYGLLQIDKVTFGGLQIPGLITKLAMRSDSFIFQKHIQATLLKGVVHLQDLVAYHVLQPQQRQVRMHMQLRSLNLRHLQRNVTDLPVAGQVDADFPRLHFAGGRLQTEGSMDIRVAKGRIRIHDVEGWDLLSQIPSIRSSLKTEEPLSLLALTQIYPIGDMGGTLHFTVDGLTFTAGEPAAFRLHFHVQKKGGEARQITLLALNNLLFTTGSAQIETDSAYYLPYRRFGAEVTLQHDTLRLRGLYKDRKGREYFMRAPALGGGVSIVNRTPQNGIAFRSFVRRLKSTVVERPDVSIK